MTVCSPARPEICDTFTPSSSIQKRLPAPSPERLAVHLIFGDIVRGISSPAATFLVTTSSGNTGTVLSDGRVFSVSQEAKSSMPAASNMIKELNIFIFFISIQFKLLHSLLSSKAFSLFITDPLHDIIVVSYQTYRSSHILKIHISIKVEVITAWVEIRIIILA